MSPATLNRWLVWQAAAGSVVLAWLGWHLARGEFAWWIPAVLGGLIVPSYLALWSVLGAGRFVADFATLFRMLGLLAILLAVGSGTGIGWGLWGAMVLLVVSDLLDGWCARRFGGSAAGAILDMETDQFVVLGLAVLAAGIAEAGVWTLLLPSFKYAYVLGLRAAGIPAHDPKPRAGDNRRGRIVCATVMVLLLASLCPWFTAPAAMACSAAAVLALAFSFTSDAVYLWRQRGGVRGAEQGP